MSVRIEIALHVEGDGPVETSLREHCAWLDKHGQYTAEYHDMMAHLALTMAKLEWLDADQYRRLARERSQRLEKAAARRQAKGQP
jgi:hypothetical protein